MKQMKRLISLVLTLAVVITLWPAGRVEAATAKTYHFSYRIDVLDAHNGRSLAVDVVSELDGTLYIYKVYAGDKKPTKEYVKQHGKSNLISAKVETTAYDWGSYNMSKKYDIYLVFEDPWGKLYGPYVRKNWIPRYFPKGNGKISHPYEIWNERHLRNATDKNEKGVQFILKQDLDMDPGHYYGTIFGAYSSFYASFNGDGHTIRGLNGSFCGRVEKGAQIHDLYFVNAHAYEQAVICNGANWGTIKSCAVVNSVIDNPGLTETGAIAGTNHGVIKRCEVKGTSVYSNSNSGGIVGEMRGGSIELCYAEARVVSRSEIGGICGRAYGGRIDGCLSNPIALRNGLSRGGIVGNVTGECVVTGNASLYLPSNPEKNYEWQGSITGDTRGSDYADFVGGNMGAVSTLPTPPVNNGDENAYQRELQEYEKKCRVWTARNGEFSLLTGDYVDQFEHFIPILVTNKVAFVGVHFAYSRAYPNETKEYNKAYPMKEITLKVKTASRPAKVVVSKIARKDNAVTLTWNKVSKAAGYEVQYCVGKYGVFEKYYDSNEKDTKFQSYALSKGEQYGFRVRAYKTVKGTKVYGPYSLIKYITIPK